MLRGCLLLCAAALAMAARHPSLHPFLFGRPTGGMLNYHLHQLQQDVEASESDAFPGVKANISQPIDHFDATNTATYQQRYWYNPTFSQNKSIIFLLIQGESIATDVWASNPNYTYQKLARSYGADIFQLEHRCFGFSRPFPDTSFRHLSTCDIAQALADIDNFIKTMNKQYNFQKPKWVTFGGSYPGALSALFRMLYPQSTVGAVASSAPMQWTLDFYQYAQVVERVLLETDPQCQKNVASAFSQMQQMSLSNEGREALNKAFNLQPAFVANTTTQLDVDNFFANLYSYFQGVIQYTYDGRSEQTRGGFGARGLCTIMTNGTDVIANVARVVDWVNVNSNVPVGPFANSYSDMMTALKNTTYDDENPDQDNAAARGWMWLCCNQLGALQTTDQGRNAFQQTVPLNYFIDMCTQMFDPAVDIKYIRDRNYALLQKYKGADGYKATNVVLPNGSYDPWHVLGVFKNDTVNHMTSILIPGAAHCSDMYMKYPNEPAALDNARALINQEVAYFIGEKVKDIPY